MRVHQSFAVQRYLAQEVSLEKILMEGIPKSYSFACKSKAQGGKGRWINFQPQVLKPMVLFVQVKFLVEFLTDNCREIPGEEMASFFIPLAED